MPDGGDADLPPLLVICRDLPGEHVGCPDCWCCPGIFDADDDVGIQRFMAEQARIVT